MPAFFTWYLILTLLGWLTFPLVYHLFPALTDRGYTLARTAGLLIWGYAFWLFTSLGFTRNDSGGILFALATLIALSIWSLIAHHSSLVNFVRSNIPLIITTETLFLIAFAFLAFARSANAELASTEKPMELMFINSILQSETFPPQDAWLSGYAISYYYFGYVMTAMLASLSSIPGSLAHNLMTSLVFALGAIGSYGIVYNLLSKNANLKSPISNRGSSIFNALLAPLFLLLVSNFETVLEVLHRRGLFWSKSPDGTFTSAFWTWLDMKELSQPPVEPFGWIPERYLWWWRASRVIQDYDMLGAHREVIDEFPFFSFLLGDLHPHVLAIPFGLLAISVALNVFLGGWKDRNPSFMGGRLDFNPTGFFFAALVLGGLAFLNTWDILIAAALIVSAYILWRANENGWNGSRFEDIFILGIPLGVFSLLLYLPFYLGFSSQAGGILPNFMYPTRGIHFWVMWGTLLIPIFFFLLYLWRKSPARPNWKLGFTIGLGLTFVLGLLTLLLGLIGSIVEKGLVDATLASYNMTAPQFLTATSLRRLNHIGSLITLLAVLVPALALLFSREDSDLMDTETQITDHQSQLSDRFPLLLLFLGALLVLVPEFVFLRDQFGYRINTVFKFYYQAWMLWSLAAAFGVGYLAQSLRGFTFANVGFRLATGLVIFCGLLYPVFGLMTRTENFKPHFGFNLDDFARIQRENPDDAAGIEFLLTQPEGVVAEAVGGSYSYYGRISTFTGYPTVLGWPGHEAQWRGGYELHGSRENDVLTLYATARWEEAKTIIERYNIRYIFIGNLERNSMPVNEEKFAINLTPIFQQGGTVIYETP